MNVVLKSGYYGSLLKLNNVDWSVDEFLNLENKIAFYFKNTKKDNIMSEEEIKDNIEIIIFVDFLRKK